MKAAGLLPPLMLACAAATAADPLNKAFRRETVMKRSASKFLLSAVLVASVGCKQKAGEAPPALPAPAASISTAAAAATPPRQAYFGDLHLHTSMSFDAYTMGTNTLPDDSYRFAQGEAVDYLGQSVQRKVPLDFLGVTDHSEYLGVFRIAGDANGPFANTKWPKLLHPDLPQDTIKLVMTLSPAFGGAKPVEEFRAPELIRSNWQHQIDSAEKYNKPGKFTTFVAYEWTAMPNADNLHRNVIFRGPTYPEKPFSSIDSFHPEELWTYAEARRREGIDSVIISHNSNVSGGLMFDYKDSYGQPIGRDYAEARLRNEQLVEISQGKGTSDTRPELSPTDEFANFELLKQTSFSGAFKPETFGGSYARSGYARGLEIESRIGVNPYQYGLVGATDFHSGISATEENNFPGAHGVADSHQNPKLALAEKGSMGGLSAPFISAGALTGVWAEQNTRESIFDALKRKEAFATSGNRIQVRLFAGWNYPADLVKREGWVKTAYADGVAMGSDLPAASAGGGAPTFVLQAIKDPDGGNLDRIQIIKLSFKDGQSQEKIFDALWSGERKPDAGGKLPPVGDTVDLKTARYTNSIGASELSGVWSDPEFEAGPAAVYYARVLEIPTPRWTTYLAVQNGLPLPTQVPATIQERAWTSPVFYHPSTSP